MNEKPILFNTAMVNAIMDGRKTQTRRVIKPQPKCTKGSHRWYWEKALDVHGSPLVDASRHWWEYYGTSPYGLVDDHLWVRETFWHHGRFVYTGNLTETGKKETKFVPSRTDNPIEGIVLGNQTVGIPANRFEFGWHKRPSIFMPRYASRITLEVTAIRVERVQGISEDDAVAEGIEKVDYGWKCYDGEGFFATPSNSFDSLWDSINEESGYGWDENPWVWVVDFGVMTDE